MMDASTNNSEHSSSSSNSNNTDNDHQSSSNQQQLDETASDFNYSDIEEGDSDDDDENDNDDSINNIHHDDNYHHHTSTDENRDSNDSNESSIANPSEVQQQPDVVMTTTILDEHIQRLDWSAVLRRIKSHPQECHTIDPMNGQTPLHVACDTGAPAVVIQSLCQAYPEASIRTDRCNMNPLHIACSSSNASLHTVRALLNHGLSEQISMRDVDGDTPLHTACRCGAHKDILDVLLRTYPGAIHVLDYEGLTPLVRLWVRYYVILGENEINSIVENPSKIYHNAIAIVAWEQTQLLLRYAHFGTAIDSSSSSLSSTTSSAVLPTSIYTTSTSLQQQIQRNNHLMHSARGTTGSSDTVGTIASNHSQQQHPHEEDQSSLSVLHAAAAVDCPRFIVQLVAHMYRQQLYDRDDHGRTPLMIACAAPIYPYHNLSDDTTAAYVDSDIENDSNDEDDRNVNNVGPQAALDYRTTAASQQVTATSTLERRDTINSTNTERKPSVIELLLQASTVVPEGSDTIINSSKCGIAENEQMMMYGGANLLDPSGRLPLHIAIDSGKSWYDGIDALVKIYPESITITDRSTKLYPYQLAATKAIQNEHTINDCYILLRLNPTLLSLGTLTNSVSANNMTTSTDNMSNTMSTNPSSNIRSNITNNFTTSTGTSSLDTTTNVNTSTTINNCSTTTTSSEKVEFVQRKKRKL